VYKALALLREAGRMPQRELMRRYQELGGRPRPDQPSGFLNVFMRYAYYGEPYILYLRRLHAAEAARLAAMPLDRQVRRDERRAMRRIIQKVILVRVGVLPRRGNLLEWTGLTATAPDWRHDFMIAEDSYA
jgi:hypothetical protein